MDEKEPLARLKRIGSRLRIFFLVCFFGISALLVVISVLVVVSLVAPGSLPVESGLSWFSLLSMGIYLIPALAIIRILVNMFSDVSQEGSPFLRKQAKRIRWIAFFIFVDVLFGVILSPAFVGAVTAGGVELGFATTGNLPTYYASFDIWEAFLALILFCLSYAFEYGSLLQEDSDDTL